MPTTSKKRRADQTAQPVDETARKKSKKTPSSAVGMPPAYTSAQKSAIAQFTSFTGLDKTAAARYLKQYNWNTENAVGGYYNSGNAPTADPKVKSTLGKLFDTLRDEPKTAPDSIGTSGSLEYFEKVGVDPEDIGVFLVSELLQCPSMGTIDRNGFIEGWASTGDDTISKQASRVSTLLTGLKSDRTRYDRLYKYTFPLVKEETKRALELDEAIAYWGILFGSSSSPVQWNSKSVAWLDLWNEFLQSQWKKSVNKDMWEQTLKFADETLKHGSLDFWTEDSAWPGVIDDFVEFANEKLGTGKRRDAEDEEMEY